MIEFSYKEERLSEHKTVFRPVADVILIAENNTEVEIPMYIDSGADLSLIPLRFGKALGFTKEGRTIEEMRGIASTLPYIRQNVKFKPWRPGSSPNLLPNTKSHPNPKPQPPQP